MNGFTSKWNNAERRQVPIALTRRFISFFNSPLYAATQHLNHSNLARFFSLFLQHLRLAFKIILLVLIAPLFSNADTQRFIDYEYDGAGNIISVRASQNLGPPDVTKLSPAFIHKESFASITATGINLAKATVSINAPGVTLIDIKNVSDTEIALRFYADETAESGAVPITFTTRLGSDVENMSVAERTPVVSTEPNPIILSPTDLNVAVKLTFDKPYDTEQIFDVAITDETVAAVSEQQVTLLAGETEVTVTISAVNAGTTTFEINQLSNFLALGIPVLVIDEPLPEGTYGAYSRPLGVAAYIPAPSSTNGPFVTKAVGVGAYIPAPSSTNGPFVTKAVGVGAYIPAPSSTNGPFITDIVGSTYGTAVDEVTPQTVARGNSVTLTITGYDLNNVTQVTFLPSDGTTQTGTLTATQDGSQLTIDITVDGAAATGDRYIQFTDGVGNHVYTNGVFQITN